MSTIAEMVVRLTGDNSSLRSTFADSAQLTTRFANDLKRITDQLATRPIELKLRTEEAEAKLAELKTKLSAVGTPAAMAEYGNLSRGVNQQLASIRREMSDLRVTARIEGEKAALALVESMDEAFSSQQASIKEALWGGSITGQQARAMGAVSAIQFNEGIRAAMEGLGNAGLLTPQLEASLNEQMKVVGDAAGIALGTAMRESIAAQAPKIAAGMQGATRSVLSAEGQFTSFGRRGGQALIGLGFGIESFANGTGTGMRRAARAVESFALMFGPEGLIAAGLITGGIAIYDYFHKAEKAADDAAKKIEQTMVELANANNQIGLEKQLQNLELGERASLDPHTNRAVFHDISKADPTSYEGSWRDLAAKQRAAQKALEDAMTGFSSPAQQDKLVAQLKQANAALKPVAEEREKLMAALRGDQMLPQMEFKPHVLKIEGTGANAALKDTGAEIAAISAHMDTLLKSGDKSAETYRAIGRDVARLLDLQVGLTGEARRTGETFENWQKRLTDVTRIGDQVRKTFANIKDTVDSSNVPDYGAMKMPPVAVSPQMQALNDAVNRVKLMTMNIDITNAARKAAGQSQLSPDEMLGGNRKDVLDQALEYRKAIMGANLPLELQVVLLEQIVAKLREAGVDASSVLSKYEQWSLSLNKVAGVVGALGGLLDSLGDKSGAKLLSDVSNAANAISAAVVQGGTNPVADIQAAASVVSVVKDLLDSPLQREQLQAMRENNRQLNAVALRLQGFQTNAGNRTSAGQAVGAALAAGKGGLISTFELVGGLQKQIDVLTPYLKSVGLTWLQFAQIAKDSGFQIFDSAGRIMLGPLEQFAAATKDAVKALFTFSSGYSDQLQLITLQNNLSGKVSESDRFAAQLAALQKVAPKLLPGSFNTGTQEGQNALRDALKALVAGLQAGTIDPSSFGGFTSLQDLLGAINPLIDSLNAMNAATVATTTSLVNVPPTFKYAMAVFDATQGDPLSPTIPSASAPSVGAGARPTGSSTTNITFQVGSLSVVMDPASNGSVSEQANAMVKALRAEALAQFGDADRWAQVQPF